MENSGLSYCEVELGGYAEFDHEPTVNEIGTATETILEAIMTDARRAKFYVIRRPHVVFRTPEDGKREYEEDKRILGEEFAGTPKNVWTFALKVRVGFSGGAKNPFENCRTFLREGTTPEPIVRFVQD